MEEQEPLKSKSGPTLVESSSDWKAMKSLGFTLHEVIGSGSYAKVYKAEYAPKDTNHKPFKLACKIINIDAAGKSFAKGFLARELDVLSKVNHTNVVRCHSMFARGSKFFIFMQFADRGDLLEHIRSHGPLPEVHAKTWFLDILRGLRYLHSLNIAHRDMKCENILITREYHCKITDFGFSRFIENQEKSSTYCGSLAYVAPEILRGKPYDPKKSDIWALGVILFVLLNKSLPFNEQNPKLMHEKAMQSKWAFRNSVKDRLSSDCKYFTKAVLEPDPGVRLTFELMLESPWLYLATISRQLKRLSDFSRPNKSVAETGEVVMNLVDTNIENAAPELRQVLQSTEMGKKINPEVWDQISHMTDAVVSLTDLTHEPPEYQHRKSVYEKGQETETDEEDQKHRHRKSQPQPEASHSSNARPDSSDSNNKKSRKSILRRFSSFK